MESSFQIQNISWFYPTDTGDLVVITQYLCLRRTNTQIEFWQSAPGLHSRRHLLALLPVKEPKEAFHRGCILSS